MPDFMDRFGAQLRAAQATPSMVVSQRREVRRLRRPSLRVGAIVAGALVLTAPALALTRPWSPLIGRPGHPSPSASAAPVSPGFSNRLAVLRRPQTDVDRAAAAPILGTLDKALDGIQTADIRQVSEGYVVIPVLRVTGDEPAGAQICLAGDGSFGCNSLQNFNAHGVGVNKATYSSTAFAGVVPDGITSVRFVDGSGTVDSAPVVSNFYSLTIRRAGTAPTATIPGPPGTSGRIPAPPVPVSGRLELIDANGHVTR